MLITRSNGHTDSEYRDEFPVSELQPGAHATLCLRIGGQWQVIVEEAHADYILVKGEKGPLRFESDEITEIKLKW